MTARKPDLNGYRCGTCGQWHEALPLDYSFDAPVYWYRLSEKERAKSFLDADRCVIENEHFFVRGLIEVPLVDSEDRFCWGVWVSLSRKNFKRAVELWDDPRLLEEAAYFGWLSSVIPGYPDTLILKTNVRWRDLKLRPFIELEPTDHPLAIEQRNGITRARLIEIAQIVQHTLAGNR